MKRLKKDFTAVNKRYFKWDYYHFSCFHAQTCTMNMGRATYIRCWISNWSKQTIWNLPRYEFYIIFEHVNTQINLTRRRYVFFHFHIGQFTYRASCKGCLNVSKQTLRLANLWKPVSSYNIFALKNLKNSDENHR